MNDKIKISFMGDVMVEHTRLESYEKDGKYDFTLLFSKCRELFNQSDYVVANLETPIAGEKLGYSSKNYNFNTPEEILDSMKFVGINMVTTANNHVLDRGIEGIDKTIDNIEKCRLDYTGTSKTGGRKEPLIKEINGVRIGFLSYTYGTEACYNMHYLQKKDQYRVNLLRNQELYNPIQRYVVRSRSIFAIGIRLAVRIISPNFFNRGVEDYTQHEKRHKDQMLSDVRFCKEKKCEIIIMCLHSGGQFNRRPTNYTKRIAKYCKDIGIDVVVGNHEHRIQQFDFKNEIAYCLGNYTSNYGIDRTPYDKNAECSILLHMYIEKNLKRKYAFSIMISRLNESGQIITVPLYDEYVNSIEDNDEKTIQYLLEANTRAYNDFCNTSHECIEPQIEYMC